LPEVLPGPLEHFLRENRFHGLVHHLLGGLRVLVTKPLDAGFQVGALIGEDLSGQAGLSNRLLQLLKDDLTIGASHWKQGNGFDILMAEHQIGAR